MEKMENGPITHIPQRRTEVSTSFYRIHNTIYRQKKDKIQYLLEFRGQRIEDTKLDILSSVSQ